MFDHDPNRPPIDVETVMDAIAADEADEARVTRLRNVALAMVQRTAVTAPDAVRDEAIIRICAWLYDSPNYTTRPGNPLRDSGAGALLRPYVERKAMLI